MTDKHMPDCAIFRKPSKFGAYVCDCAYKLRAIQSGEEHMPDCAALLCQYRHEFMVAHCLGEKIVHRKGGSCAGHKFQPGTCNCELGRLRAESEKHKQREEAHFDAYSKMCDQNEKLKAKYQELIMAVASKFPGETRHETALRYITNAESGANCGVSKTGEQPDG